ncbi:MAG: peptide deformylase [Patescibacteria group bacterium]|nr:peptide deformylase [Patescibacteria group bacterium]MDE1988538.1 peptide deformylase [Patescibacteria group bacterium]MDE2218449.1 peptide deformylase [Patescibacteria group bacterium]
MTQMAQKKIAKKIVQAKSGNPVLRDFAEPVPLEEIKSDKIQKIIEDMKNSLATEEEGVAIAAPQIGAPLRIFVVSKKIFQLIDAGKNDKERFGDLVFINPEIIKLSKDKEVMEEGCLSVRDYYGKIKRSTKATVRAYDENGSVFERGGSWLLAQIFQHEIDHLNGILFIDSAKDVQKIVKEKKIEKNN